MQVNGEIYNHEQLRESLTGHKFKTGSDCDVIAHLVSNSEIFTNSNLPFALTKKSKSNQIAKKIL